MLLGVLMTPQAASASLLRRGVFERKDLRLVAAAVDVFFTRAMASLASMPFGTFVSIEFRVHGSGEVSGRSEVCVEIFVAGFAGVRAYVERGIGRSNILGGGLSYRLVFVCGAILLARYGDRPEGKKASEDG